MRNTKRLGNFGVAVMALIVVAGICVVLGANRYSGRPVYDSRESGLSNGFAGGGFGGGGGGAMVAVMDPWDPIVGWLAGKLLDWGASTVSKAVNEQTSTGTCGGGPCGGGGGGGFANPPANSTGHK